MTSRPPRPSPNMSPELYTFQDAVDHLADAFDFKPVARAERIAIRAVQEAYRELPNLCDWTCLRKQGRLTTTPQQTAGTVEFLRSDGPLPRQLTLTDAIWPDDVINRKLLLDRRVCGVEQRVSDTVVLLKAETTPYRDYPAGTDYVLFQDTYLLPPDFCKGTRLVELGLGCWPVYLDPGKALEWQTFQYAPIDRPGAYTIRSSANTYGGVSLQFSPPPATRRDYDYTYRSTARPMRTFGRNPEYALGTVSVSGTTVTGTGTGWTSRMVGCVLRLGDDSGRPPGGILSSDEDAVPFTEFRIVTGVMDDQTLMIDSPLEGSYSEVSYTIGDPLDMDAAVMLTPFWLLAEAIYARLTTREDAMQRQRTFLEGLRQAKGADYRNDQSDTNGSPAWMSVHLGGQDEGDEA